MKDEEKSRTGNHAKADSGSGPEEEKNNETKGMPDNEPEEEPGNELEESEKGRRLARGVKVPKALCSNYFGFAAVVELADTMGLGPIGRPCRFESC